MPIADIRWLRKSLTLTLGQRQTFQQPAALSHVLADLDAKTVGLPMNHKNWSLRYSLGTET